MDKTSENYSASNQQRSPQPKPATSSASNRLTPSEIEQLQQDKKTSVEYALKAQKNLLKK